MTVLSGDRRQPAGLLTVLNGLHVCACSQAVTWQSNDAHVQMEFNRFTRSLALSASFAIGRPEVRPHQQAIHHACPALSTLDPTYLSTIKCWNSNSCEISISTKTVSRSCSSHLQTELP